MQVKYRGDRGCIDTFSVRTNGTGVIVYGDGDKCGVNSVTTYLASQGHRWFDTLDEAVRASAPESHTLREGVCSYYVDECGDLWCATRLANGVCVAHDSGNPDHATIMEDDDQSGWFATEADARRDAEIRQ